MQISFKQALAKILDWIHFPTLHNSAVNIDTYYRARRDDTDTEVAFGVGSGGINHGVWSYKQGRWLLYGDATDIYLGTKNMTNRWHTTAYKAVSITATGQTLYFGNFSLPANGQYLVLSNVISNKGATATILNNIVVTSGTATENYGSNTRVTTSSGQGVANWRYIKTGGSAVTVTLEGYSYPDGGTGYTQSGYMIAIML